MKIDLVRINPPYQMASLYQYQIRGQAPFALTRDMIEFTTTPKIGSAYGITF